jgi:hypothetical protein
MADPVELLVRALNGAGPHPSRPDVYQVFLTATPALGGASQNLILTFQTTEALGLLGLLQAKPPNRPGQ